jgi:hypothetical protein
LVADAPVVAPADVAVAVAESVAPVVALFAPLVLFPVPPPHAAKASVAVASRNRLINMPWKECRQPNKQKMGFSHPVTIMIV